MDRGRTAAARRHSVLQRSEAMPVSLGRAATGQRADCFGDRDADVYARPAARAASIWRKAHGATSKEPVTDKKLADILGGYDAGPEQVARRRHRNSRGYKRALLLDAWARYLPPTETPSTNPRWAPSPCPHVLETALHPLHPLRKGVLVTGVNVGVTGFYYEGWGH